MITPLVDQTTGVQTTVNGSSAPQLFTGLWSDSGIGLSGGNDELYIKGIAFPDDVTIFGGAGGDTIRIGELISFGQFGTGDVNVAGWLRIDEQFDTSIYDAEHIFLGRVTSESIIIQTNYGDDVVEFYNVTTTTTDPISLYMRGEDGHDVFNLAYVTVWGGMDLAPDKFVSYGNDLISMITSVVHGAARLDGAQGYNTIALNANQFLGAINISGNEANDTFIITNSFLNGYITLTSFGGNDYVRFENNVISEYVALSAGTGYDTVIVQSNQIYGATMYMGADSDSLTIRYNIFYTAAYFYGREGYDLLYNSGNLYLGPSGAWEFEVTQA